MRDKDLEERFDTFKRDYLAHDFGGSPSLSIATLIADLVGAIDLAENPGPVQNEELQAALDAFDLRTVSPETGDLIALLTQKVDQFEKSRPGSRIISVQILIGPAIVDNATDNATDKVPIEYQIREAVEEGWTLITFPLPTPNFEDGDEYRTFTATMGKWG